jgi:tetratricopeptide (TPR) repeat protein
MKLTGLSLNQIKQMQRLGRSNAARGLGLLLLWTGLAGIAQAQTAEPTNPPPAAPNAETLLINPLESPELDPLLPTMVVDRPLNPQEKAVLQTALDELQQQGQARLEAGDLPGALQIWNRELRLRRFLGPQAEVASLQRVGQVAWQQSQATELRFITLRLEQIEQEAKVQPTVDYELLQAIAEAYQTVRARTQAVALYNQLLERARQQQDVAQQRQYLTELADLHLGWFDYPNAAIAYQELLTLASSTGDPALEVEALTQLAYIYQENNQPEQAIAVQQQLTQTYQNQQNFQPIPALKIAIADSYVLLGRPDLAATSYQEAFAAARSTQQLAYASDALQRLADLYRSLDRLDDALIVYQLLLDVEQQSYNSFGMMNTYDQIGQLHRAQGNQAQANIAFRQGLQLAQQLNYKVDYFNQQLEQSNQ